MNPNQQSNQPQTTAPQVQPLVPQPPVQPQAPQLSAQPAMPELPPVQPQAQPQRAIVIEFEPDLKFQITADKVDDMRFMDLYAEVSEDQLKIPKLMRFLLGAEEYDSIFTYYESRGQRFSITKFGQVFEKLDKDLNSQPDFLKG